MTGCSHPRLIFAILGCVTAEEELWLALSFVVHGIYTLYTSKRVSSGVEKAIQDTMANERRRKMNMKKILTLCIVALMTIEAGGCGDGSAALDSAANNKDESAVLSEATAITGESVSAQDTSAAADESVLAQSPESAATDESIPSEEETAGEDDVKLSDDASDFVLLSEAVPDAILEIRYYSTYNFIGDRVDGYEEPLAFLTKEAAAALREVSDDVIAKGYRLKIYDAYRPQRAVTNFVNWAKEPDDTRMKEYFYPELDKDVLFPQGYIAEHSGHSRGSTVDLTLFDMRTEKEVDMGGTFDYFGELSHPDYREITDEQYENRMILREAMTSHGFKPLVEEWWHFTLENEPYPDTYFTFPINSDSLKEVSSKPQTAGTEAGTLSREGYELQKVVILSRHNIRSPLSGKGSVLDTLTPYTWFNWSSSPSALSLRGGTLETEMGQYFRKWLEQEGLFPENYQPKEGEVRIYSNSKQRTIATSNYFKAGLLPVADTEVEYNAEYDTMDPVFEPKLTFITDEYIEAATEQMQEIYEDGIPDLTQDYSLLADVIDVEESEDYLSGNFTGFSTEDTEFILEEGKEPAMKGSLKTACSVSDALVLQFFEADAGEAAFGKSLTAEQWDSISEIKDIYGDVLFTAPLVAANVANPLLKEIQSELGEESRKFTFLCGHDSNVASVLAALGASDYELPSTVEHKTPIGGKLVFGCWTDADGKKYISLDMVYQSTEQLQNLSLLDLENPPMNETVPLDGLLANEQGLYAAEEVEERIQQAIDEYDVICEEYAMDAAA